MGVFKDKLFLEVWKFLLKQRDKSSLLSGINAPREGRHGVRAAWKDICDNRPAEGLKTKTGMRDVLYERPDLFVLTESKQHPVVSLADGALRLDPRDGLPAYGGGSGAPQPDLSMVGSTLPPVLADGEEPDMNGYWDEDEEGDADGAAGSSDLMQPMKAGRMASTLAGLESGQVASLASFLGVPAPEAKAKAAPKQEKKKEKVAVAAILPSSKWDFTFPNWNIRTNGYGDIVWTPQIAEEKLKAEKKEWALARALFNVVQAYGGGPVPMSQVGSHYSVQALKKEPAFKTMKLIEFCRVFPDVYELIPDQGGGSGFMCKLMPGAEAALPGDPSEAMADDFGNELAMKLPPFIQDPQTAREKMQCLRVEIIHSLANRGSKLPLPEIGQDPRVQKAKSQLSQFKKVIEFLKFFPMNFRITEFPHQVVELVSPDVDDESGVDRALRKEGFGWTPNIASSMSNRPSGSSRPAPLALENAPSSRRSPPRRDPPRGRSPRGRSPRGRSPRGRSRRRRSRSRSRRGGGGGGRDSGRDSGRDRDRRTLTTLD
eukprot:TRINITY_DN10949_c0_g3_i1.p1 TRINITY_DN10949_c0_g3~~TRINITY_DN10949_c0_g3_i1.p1  ORF type:complete len:543 (-),score=99.77 TRINITY_DN10949_c0_g3_i1:224-1852(-)